MLFLFLGAVFLCCHLLPGRDRSRSCGGNIFWPAKVARAPQRREKSNRSRTRDLGSPLHPLKRPMLSRPVLRGCPKRTPCRKACRAAENNPKFTYIDKRRGQVVLQGCAKDYTFLVWGMHAELHPMRDKKENRLIRR